LTEGRDKFVATKVPRQCPLVHINFDINLGRAALLISKLKIPIECSKTLINLKPKLVCIIFKDSVFTAKKTQLVSITKITWLILFKEIIAVYSENHAKL
jgi:hypothetical protein